MITLAIALICAFLGAAVTIGCKILSSTLPSFAYLFLRYGFAALCLLPFVGFQKEKIGVERRYFPLFMLLGFTQVFMFETLFFNAVHYSSAISVSLIMATNPILTMLISAAILKHIPQRYQLVSLMLSFCGVVLVITEGKMGFSALKGSLGEFLALLGLLFQIMYALTLKKVSAYYSPLVLACATVISGTLFVVPFIANKEFVTIVVTMSRQQWVLIGLIGSLGTALAIVLYSIAVKDIGPTRTSLIVFSSVPVFVMVLAYLFLGEAISRWQVIGGCLVISSLLLELYNTR